MAEIDGGDAASVGAAGAGVGAWLGLAVSGGVELGAVGYLLPEQPASRSAASAAAVIFARWDMCCFYRVRAGFGQRGQTAAMKLLL